MTHERYVWYIKRVYVCRYLWMFLDFFTLCSKRYFKRLYPGMIIKQSEHIQFFTEYSLSHVLQDVGFIDLEFSRYSTSETGSNLGIESLGVLCRKP